jgi:hypothetical protein
MEPLPELGILGRLGGHVSSQCITSITARANGEALCVPSDIYERACSPPLRMGSLALAGAPQGRAQPQGGGGYGRQIEWRVPVL